MKALEAKGCCDLGDLVGEAVEIGDSVRLRTPSRELEQDHTEPLGEGFAPRDQVSGRNRNQRSGDDAVAISVLAVRPSSNPEIPGSS